MKKSMIKRRKRVAPALGDAAPSPSEVASKTAEAGAELGEAESPYLAPALPVHLERRPRESRRGRRKDDADIAEQVQMDADPLAGRAVGRAPPTIDFTGYRPGSVHGMNGVRSRNGMKRPLSDDSIHHAVPNGHAHGHASSGMGVDEMPLDPSLRPTTGRGAAAGQQQAQTERESYKAERRAQLQREVEGIREVLRIKERELAMLQ
jgi:GATA-binding protein, other eukaryote